MATECPENRRRRHFSLEDMIWNAPVMPSSEAPKIDAHDASNLMRHVALEALSLPERIELFRRCPDVFSENPNLSRKRLANWRHVLGVPEGEPITRRLASLGLEAGELDLLLGDLRPDAIETMETPSWWSICEGVLSRAQMLEPGELPTAEFFTGEGSPEASGEDSPDEGSPEPMLPFEHALGVWVQVGTDLLRAAPARVESIIGPAMLRREQRGLLENLCILARSTLLSRFQAQKLQMYDSNDLALGLFASDPPRDAYISTVAGVLNDGAAGLMRSRPALARLLATRVECWVRTLTEFARHLEDDRPLLERVFNGDEPLGALVSGGRGISDSHNGGRAVVVCRFESGTKIVYKPRDMAVDEAWNRIVEAFNLGADTQLQLKTLTVLNRGGYGWMEFSARTPCEDEAEVRAYYVRMGSLLALIHALQGNDFHLENVVAAGAYPVAIDLETISVPDPHADTGGIEPDLASEQVARSVLRTQLLPSVMAMRGRDGMRNLGAVGVEVEEKQRRHRTHRKMDKVNTDFLRWVTVPGDDPALQLDDQSKVERADGEKVDPNRYSSEVISGYQRAYRSILESHATWLAVDGPLTALEGAWVRVLNRSTNIYYRLLLETCSDRCLVSGLDRSIHSERLLVNQESTEAADESLQALTYTLASVEQAALLRGDIAYFLSRGRGSDYFSPDAVSGEPIQVAGAQLKESAFECARDQIRAMEESNLDLQIFLMRSSYLVAQISVDGMMHGDFETAVKADENPTQGPDPLELDAWILRSLQEIDGLAVRLEGRVNWIDAKMDPNTQTAQPAAMAASLYDGRGGLALLFEWAYRYFGDEYWLDLARQSIAWEFQMASAVSEGKRFSGFDVEGPAGLVSGRTGLITAAWVIGRHEGQGAYREVAKELLTGLNDRIIERDTSYDVVGGSAGYLLLAMHLDREESIAGLEPVLEALSDHLVHHATDTDGIGWVSRFGQKALNGFGHGRAGIGLALLEAGTRLNRPDLRELGLAALKAESEMRGDDPAIGWPDLRGLRTGDPIPPRQFFHAWCAGSDGVALSRCAALQYADDRFLKEDLDFSIAAMQKPNAVLVRSHLCCGSAGRAETWRGIRKLTGDTTKATLASAALARCVDVTEVDCTSPASGTLGLGLWQGTAGRIWSAMSELRQDDNASILLLRP
jgi:type 2 lantibiotic biosynthesis protein LanM